jgi:hypothetical protein
MTDKGKEQLEREMDSIIIINNSTGKDIRGGAATIIKNKKSCKWEKVEEGVFLKGRLIHIKIGRDHCLNVYKPANIYKR